MTERNLTVTEAAQRLGIHPNTLRSWADKGLVNAMVLPGSGYRRFKPAVIEALRTAIESGEFEGKAVA